VLGLLSRERRLLRAEVRSQPASNPEGWKLSRRMALRREHLRKDTLIGAIGVTERGEQWEAVNKALTALIIAHAAGLVTCLTLLKDYTATGSLRGMGTFVWVFGVGLILAILTEFFWLVLRKPFTDDRVFEVSGSAAIFVVVLALSHFSVIALFVAIGIAISKYGRL
jgi:hypothetical protein